MQTQHIYWFSYFNMDEPSVRYRATYPLQYLQDHHNIAYTIIYPGRSLQNIGKFFITFLSIIFFRRSNSIIVFQKIYTKGLYATALKLLLFLQPDNTVYDIDDAEHTRRPAETIHYFMKRVSFCTVGSHALAEYAGKFNKHVLIATSPVMEHNQVKSAQEELFTIGWVGYYTAHRESLYKLLFPALTKLDFPVRLKLLGVRQKTELDEIRQYFKNQNNIQIEAPLEINWLDEMSVYKEICTFDIGVSPLMDNEFNRAKSAFKLKQCLSCGVPVLASKLGENAFFIKNEINGYFCMNADDFFEKIVSVKNGSRAEYDALCSNARASLQFFGIEHYCDTILSYLGQQDNAGVFAINEV